MAPGAPAVAPLRPRGSGLRPDLRRRAACRGCGVAWSSRRRAGDGAWRWQPRARGVGLQGKRAAQRPVQRSGATPGVGRPVSKSGISLPIQQSVMPASGSRWLWQLDAGGLLAGDLTRPSRAFCGLTSPYACQPSSRAQFQTLQRPGTGVFRQALLRLPAAAPRAARLRNRRPAFAAPRPPRAPQVDETKCLWRLVYPHAMEPRKNCHWFGGTASLFLVRTLHWQTGARQARQCRESNCTALPTRLLP